MHILTYLTFGLFLEWKANILGFFHFIVAISFYDRQAKPNFGANIQTRSLVIFGRDCKYGTTK